MPGDLPDWTAAVSPAGSQVWSMNQAVAAGATFNGPILDVSAFIQLLLNIGSTGPNFTAAIELLWFQDAAGTQQLHFGQVFHKATNVFTNAVIPVMGPYLQVVYINSGGGQANLQANVEGFSTPSKISVVDAIGSDPVLNVQAVSIAATAAIVPSTQVSCLAKVWTQDNINASQTWGVQYWDGNIWRYLSNTINGAAGAPNVSEVVTPLSDWRLIMQLASTVFYASVNPIR